MILITRVEIYEMYLEIDAEIIEVKPELSLILVFKNERQFSTFSNLLGIIYNLIEENIEIKAFDDNNKCYYIDFRKNFKNFVYSGNNAIEIHECYSINKKEKYESVEFKVKRYDSTILKSNDLSINNNYYELIHTKTGNAKYDIIQIKFKGKRSFTFIEDIVQIVAVFYSIFHGYICYPGFRKFDEENSKVNYFESKFLETEKVRTFRENTRFKQTQELKYNNFLERWIEYNVSFENERIANYCTEMIVCEYFQKKSLSPITMHFVDSFSYLEEISKDNEITKEEKKRLNNLAKEWEPCFLSEGIKKSEVKNKIKILFDETSRKAVNKKINFYNEIFKLNTEEVEVIVNKFLFIRNSYTHEPIKYIQKKEYEDVFVLSSTVLIREILIIDYMYSNLKFSIDILSSAYKIDDILHIYWKDLKELQ